MDAAATVDAYYDALRSGNPLAPFFARDATVKFGIGERLYGFDEIAAGLTAQTETTEGWRIESERLLVTERDGYAWFSDEVGMAWRDLKRGSEYEFDTRWSGTLERRPGADDGAVDTPWRFVAMHVSTPGGTR